MIKQREIPVTIHFLPKGKESYCELRRNARGTILADIVIVKCAKREKTLASLVHELGHLVAHIFQTPAARKDPRFYEPGRLPNESSELKAVCANEKEAWQIGRKISPKVSKREERAALRAYQRADCNKKNGVGEIPPRVFS